MIDPGIGFVFGAGIVGAVTAIALSLVATVVAIANHFRRRAKWKPTATRVQKGEDYVRYVASVTDWNKVGTAMPKVAAIGAVFAMALVIFVTGLIVILT